MNCAAELIRAVEANGGRFRVEDGWLVISPEHAAAPLLEDLRRHKEEIIGLLKATDVPCEDFETWRSDFGRWLDSSCSRLPRWFSGVSVLHLNFCEWEIIRSGVPCRRDTFVRLIEDFGFRVGEVEKTLLVSGLALKSDVAAHGDITRSLRG